MIVAPQGDWFAVFFGRAGKPDFERIALWKENGGGDVVGLIATSAGLGSAAAAPNFVRYVALEAADVVSSASSLLDECREACEANGGPMMVCDDDEGHECLRREALQQENSDMLCPKCGSQMEEVSE